MATSSILVSPTFQPSGAMMLNRMITVRVNAACPAAKLIIEGAMPAMKTASGSTTHSRTAWSATPTMMAEPMTTPIAVPPTARSAVAPVPRAFDRRTDSVPRTTQNPCWTSVTSTTATARARPTAPRRALRNQTERNDTWRKIWWMRTRDFWAGIPIRRSRRPSDPAASRAASANISVAMPSARAWKPRSGVDAMPSSTTPEWSPPAGDASGRGSDGLETSCSTATLINCSSRRVDSCSSRI